jgi:hypothetical protein
MLLKRLVEMMMTDTKKEIRKEDLKAKESKRSNPKETKKVSKKAKPTKEDDF